MVAVLKMVVRVYAQDTVKLPTAPEMFEAIKKDREVVKQRYVASKRHMLEVRLSSPPCSPPSAVDLFWKVVQSSMMQIAHW